MASVNKVILIGNLGRDPEKRSTASGMSVANLSVATTYSYTDSQTRERKDETEWSRVSLFGQTADFACQYAKSGNLVYVEGRLKTRKWEDPRTGQDRYSTDIIGSVFRLLERRDSVSSGESRYTPRPDAASAPDAAAPPPASESAQPPIADDPLDDIPW